MATVLVVLCGCGSYEPAKPPAPPAQPQVQSEQPKVEEEQANEAAVPAEPEEPKTVLTKAEKGVGAKGRGYGDGVVATPLKVYFGTRERIVFDIQIPEAMKLFKAMEGRAPESHEEFMQKIIVENKIKLPELPQGHRYIYDPKTEQPMVLRPVE